MKILKYLSRMWFYKFAKSIWHNLNYRFPVTSCDHRSMKLLDQGFMNILYLMNSILIIEERTFVSFYVEAELVTKPFDHIKSCHKVCQRHKFFSITGLTNEPRIIQKCTVTISMRYGKWYLYTHIFVLSIFQ